MQQVRNIGFQDSSKNYKDEDKFVENELERANDIFKYIKYKIEKEGFLTLNGDEKHKIISDIDKEFFSNHFIVAQMMLEGRYSKKAMRMYLEDCIKSKDQSKDAWFKHQANYGSLLYIKLNPKSTHLKSRIYNDIYNSMKSRFEVIDKKYNDVSDKLEEVDEELRKKRLSDLKNYIVKNNALNKQDLRAVCQLIKNKQFVDNKRVVLNSIKEKVKKDMSGPNESKGTSKLNRGGTEDGIMYPTAVVRNEQGDKEQEQKH